MVRKLRGTVKKESKEERRARRQENLEGKQRILSVAIPVLVLVAVAIMVFIYFATRSPALPPN